MNNYFERREKVTNEFLEVNSKLANEKLNWKEKWKLKRRANKLLKELADIVCETF